MPSPYRANGNAYLVAMAYQPSGVAVTRLAGAGASMVLIIPEVGKVLFTTASSHGPWTAVAAHSIPPTDLTLGATMRARATTWPGTTLPPLAFASRSSTPVVAISVGAGLLAALVIGGGVLLIRAAAARRGSAARSASRDRSRSSTRR